MNFLFLKLENLHTYTLKNDFKWPKKALFLTSRSSCPEVFYKKGVLRNFAKFTGKHLCQSLFFNNVAGLRPATLLKNETVAQVFSFEFCKISKTFSYRTPPVAPSGHQ